ncbi:MAG: 23S rRNA (uracil(1939)-C(5))-methyltransferase RlmD [Calditrichia bacterium]
MKKNQILPLKIEKLAYKGKGVGKIDGRVVFVPYTIPGDEIEVRIRKKRKSYAEGVVQSFIRYSDKRIDPRCRYFGYCGGCKWQNIPYEYQLEVKKDIVRESLEHIGGLEIAVEPTLPSPAIWNYRNKMEFTFSSLRWLLPDELNDLSLSKENALGFHAPGAFDKIIDIEHCDLQTEDLNQILHIIREYAIEHNLPFYNVHEHSGLLRFVVFRKAAFTDELMVNIITSEDAGEQLLPLVEQITKEFPKITSIVNSINPDIAQVAFGKEHIVLHGRDYIWERLGPYKFRISPNSFFQTNSRQALQMYTLVKELAGLTGKEIVWDLYGGTGTIGIFISAGAGKVTSIELIEAASLDGVENAKLNGITNIEFVTGDMRDLIYSIDETPDVVITDPPRDGMHPKVVKALLEKEPKRIVYVSCNPATLARDLAQLKEKYDILRVQPVDMFPQTYHIETVLLLERKHA